MAETFVPVAPVKPAGATPTAAYTAPGGVDYALILSLVCANNSGSGGAADNITIKKVPSGGAVGDPDVELIDELSVAPQESFFFSEKVLLAAGDILAVESANGTVVFTPSILESTP